MRSSAILLVSLAALTLASSGAVATEYTFAPISGSEGRWGVQGNWTPTAGAPPGSDDVAIIPQNTTCYLADGDTEDAQRIEIQRDAVLQIQEESTLTLHGHPSQNSLVNGRLVFYYPPNTTEDCVVDRPAGVLHIADDLTIEGNGGVIFGGCRKDHYNEGHITGEEGAVLTLANKDGGELTVKGMLEIQVELVNNAAVTVTSCPSDGYDSAEHVLRLTGEPKSGSGVWSVYTGKFQVDAPVTTDGCWQVLYDADTCEIAGTPTLIINAPCLGQDAQATFEGGSNIEINDDFCASGDFILSNAPTSQGHAGMTIQVAEDKTFALGAACVSP